MPQTLYFIAIIPPSGITDDVTAFRNDFKIKYNSAAALKNMPHITLKAPFKTEAHLHGQVVHWFNNLPIVQQPFTINLCNFGAFANTKNPVVYVQPVINESLENLQKAVLNGFETAFPDIPVHFYEHTFKPHMTIAYRDLAFAEFEKAWQLYSTKEYSAQFEVNGFCLLQHNGTEWSVIAEHSLK